jgi:hypothetical protein
VYTFGPVLLPIPKFESLQFAIAKELGKKQTTPYVSILLSGGEIKPA